MTKYNGVKSKDWIKGFSIIFFSSWAIWILSNYLPLVKVIGSAEIGYIMALIAGIIITNIVNIPKWLKDSARGELFIKIAIVLLGAKNPVDYFFYKCSINFDSSLSFLSGSLYSGLFYIEKNRT
ncbi:MAG TPA: hypothetical protein VFV86_02190 [Nitrososphaeraceae archaeon]|nr:hypothetical protein [Nitrososphaeraceae archaeon]